MIGNLRQRTSATNRRLRVLLTAIADGTLIPKPEFQRRLVWTNKDKLNFLDTVLRGYPFPEIYVAAGEVNPDTGRGKELLVDGQQRISTLQQYFTGASELRLGSEIRPYTQLTTEEKLAFLEYEVVVRDLGKMSIEEIKEIFQRINATSYSLNAMEAHNARYNGELKQFAESISQHEFFDHIRAFSANDIRRMQDVSFVLIFIITIMSSYFNRVDELANYLEKYNDEFEERYKIEREVLTVLRFAQAINFSSNSRVNKKSDLLSLLVELHRVLIKEIEVLDPNEVGERLKTFYHEVENNDKLLIREWPREVLSDYSKAASQATNDRGTRIKRGKIIHSVITGNKDELRALYVDL